MKREDSIDKMMESLGGKKAIKHVRGIDVEQFERLIVEMFNCSSSLYTVLMSLDEDCDGKIEKKLIRAMAKITLDLGFLEYKAAEMIIGEKAADALMEKSKKECEELAEELGDDSLETLKSYEEAAHDLN